MNALPLSYFGAPLCPDDRQPMREQAADTAECGVCGLQAIRHPDRRGWTTVSGVPLDLTLADVA